MTPILAQAQLDGDLIVKLLMLALIVGQVAALWLGIANRNTIQKREITNGFAAASKEEHDALVRDNQKVHDQLFANISGKERGLREELGKELRGLRSDLGETTSTMHELKGEMKQLSIQLVNVQQQLQAK
ncbi:MAG TPA: hypothetical protein PKA41_14520 [Verrucomicrobiota bacterium]|nr:hypothetical protein [Verrucomicrobiota bacterium]